MCPLVIYLSSDGLISGVGRCYKLVCYFDYNCLEMKVDSSFYERRGGYFGGLL